MTVILASASRARRDLLLGAGVDILIDAAAIDEAAVKDSLRAEGAGPPEIAETLAELKGKRVSPRHAGKLVLGADQVLDCEGRIFDKPADLTAARDQLKTLRGRQHRLVSSAVVLRDDARLWHHTGQAVLTMRDFSEGFLDDYLRAVGPQACESVGAYQLEGRGAQLFAMVSGDYFTILGLPLLPLLDFLRQQGEIAA
jgi:septum formation protein